MLSLIPRLLTPWVGRSGQPPTQRIRRWRPGNKTRPLTILHIAPLKICLGMMFPKDADLHSTHSHSVFSKQYLVNTISTSQDNNLIIGRFTISLTVAIFEISLLCKVQYASRPSASCKYNCKSHLPLSDCCSLKWNENIKILTNKAKKQWSLKEL